MRPSKVLTLSTVLLVMILGRSVAAQKPGDVVFAHRGLTGTNVYSAPTQQMGNVTTLYQSGGDGIFAVHVDHGNGAVLAARHRNGLLRVTPGGGATTLLALPIPNLPRRMIARDQDGSLLMTHYSTAANAASILRIDPGRTSVTTFASLTRNVFESFCRDDATGDYLATTGLNRLLRIDRTSGAFTTVTTLASSRLYQAICYLPDRDLFALSIGRSSTTVNGELGFMTRGGMILAKVPFTVAEGRATCVAYDERRGFIHCGTTTGHIVTMSSTGTRIRSHDYGNYYVRAIDVWDDRSVSIRTTGRPGTNLEIELGFTQSGGQAYGAAFSGGLRPGIRIGGQRLNVAPDAIFFATVSQLPGFVGTLAANGRRTINFRIPSPFPSGLTFYVTAFAQNAAMPGGFDLGNSEFLRIE